MAAANGSDAEALQSAICDLFELALQPCAGCCPLQLRAGHWGHKATTCQASTEQCMQLQATGTPAPPVGRTTQDRIHRLTSLDRQGSVEVHHGVVIGNPVASCAVIRWDAATAIDGWRPVAPIKVHRRVNAQGRDVVQQLLDCTIPVTYFNSFDANCLWVCMHAAWGRLLMLR